MINIAGAADGRVAYLAAELIGNHQGQSLIVVPTYIRAKRLATDLAFFHGKTPVYILPEEEENYVAFEARSSEDALERMKILKALAGGEECVVIAPVRSAIRKLPPAESFRQSSLSFAPEQKVDLEDLARRISLMGYERVSVIEGRGEFTVRGDIVDVFPPDQEYPLRIELFDDEVDSLRSFDPQTQRSLERLTRRFNTNLTGAQEHLTTTGTNIKTEELFEILNERLNNCRNQVAL